MAIDNPWTEPHVVLEIRAAHTLNQLLVRIATMADTSIAEAPKESPKASPASDPELVALRKAFLSQQRLSMFPSQRILAATTIGFTAGGLSGLFQGSNMAGLRFRAENAHRLPSTATGWYLYHKSKNYHIMLGGIKKGFKEGMRIGSMVGFFILSEDAVDRLRAWYARGEMKRKDVGSTVVAALGTSAVFSLWSKQKNSS